MMVMLSNWSGQKMRDLAKMYPGLVGHLYSPGGQRGPFRDLPYALDNGAFSAFKNRATWTPDEWLRLIDWEAAQEQRALWALCPDVVGDQDRTLEAWDVWAHEIVSRGIRPAFAAQDGMSPADVPASASVIFLGGSLPWKWSNLYRFSGLPQHLHVGRVNTLRGLDACVGVGSKSVDGTGWFRGDARQFAKLAQFLEERSNGSHPYLF